MKLRWALCGLVLSASLLLTACNALDVPKAAPTPTPTVSQPPVSAPADRDLARLVAALTQVDSCALLDAAKAQASGFTAADKLRRTSAHSCRIVNARGEWVRIELAAGGSRVTRFDKELGTIGGAKIYRERASDDTCEVEVPVAFDYSIRIFSQRVATPTATLCQPADAFAKFAMPLLAKASVPATTPLAGWSGCGLLSAIRGRPISTFKIGAYPTNDVDGCTELDRGELVSSVSLSYGGELNPALFERITPIGGSPTGVDSPGDKCRLTWIAGPSGQSDPADKFVRLVAVEKTCALAEQLAAKMKTVLAGSVPKGAVPLFPIYLRPDEQDSDQPGACADVNSFVVQSNLEQRCRPYKPVAAPKGPAAVLRAVQADGNVACAISVEAIRQRLGAELRPVTIGGRGCRYVEPSHELEIAVAVSDRELARAGQAKFVKLGKHEGWILATHLRNRSIIDLNVNAAVGVSLRISFEFKPRRGTGFLDSAREKELVPIATAIANTYF
ncbi:DUF3558 family protein [Kribbella catacumbae]|uniref:DUF3558 family protein n=1 Tax=Kribbella catacumbae TaxID=460086 RepID=UPI00037C1084|nr:DUF3558 family protein [Kribbella catacumbae]